MIPFFDIKRQNENIRNELDEAIAGVIDGGVYNTSYTNEKV